MTTTDAKQKSCPLQRSSLCEADKCMAWQSTSKEEGFCQMVSRSRTVFVAPGSSALRIELEEGIRLKTEEPLEVRLVQHEYDCLEVRLKD